MCKAVADVFIKKFVPIEAHAWFLAPATSLEGRGNCFSCTREIGEQGAAPHSVLFAQNSPHCRLSFAGMTIASRGRLKDSAVRPRGRGQIVQ